MISISTKTSDTTKNALMRMRKQNLFADLHHYGERGVQLLRSATPVESAETANAWAYRIVQERNGPRIEWYNTHADTDGRTSVAVLIQYGHGTRNGGYVHGRDFINPAIQPYFDQIANEIWKKVKS